MISNAVSKTPCLSNCKLLALFPSSNFGQMFSVFLHSPSLVPPCTTHIHSVTTGPYHSKPSVPVHSSATFFTPSATNYTTCSMPHNPHWFPACLSPICHLSKSTLSENKNLLVIPLLRILFSVFSV